MHHAWGNNGQVERVWPSWRHTPHFRPERPTFSDGILAPPPRGQPSVAPVILCDRGDLLGSRQVVMNCLSALFVSLCGPDKLQAIHQTSLHYSAETKFNSDNSDTYQRVKGGFLPERGFLVRIILHKVLVTLLNTLSFTCFLKKPSHVKEVQNRGGVYQNVSLWLLCNSLCCNHTKPSQLFFKLPH